MGGLGFEGCSQDFERDPKNEGSALKIPIDTPKSKMGPAGAQKASKSPKGSGWGPKSLKRSQGVY